MRSAEEIVKIKSRISNPYYIENFINQQEIDHLIKLYHQNRIHHNIKTTGPVVLDLSRFFHDSVVESLVARLKQQLQFDNITSSFFFWTLQPHIIHNDDSHQLPYGIYKGITIPLELGGQGSAELCFFDQFYFHGPSKFFKGEQHIPSYYNQIQYDYDQVDGLVDHSIDKAIKDNYLSHLEDSWLEGLSFWGSIPWKPGNAIIFDSVRLHCASNFLKCGIRYKLGISIFTQRQ